MSEFGETMKSILDGVPWTEETAAAAGFDSVLKARTRTLGGASLDMAMDQDERCYEKLDERFERAVSDLRQVYGDPLFTGRGIDSDVPGFRPPAHDPDGPHRLAYWYVNGRIAFVAVMYGDNTRVASLEMGERAVQELQRPWPEAIWPGPSTKKGEGWVTKPSERHTLPPSHPPAQTPPAPPAPAVAASGQ